jgi:AraC family transcriptional regulator
MDRRQQYIIGDGRRQTPGVCLLSSEHTAWSGFLLERHGELAEGYWADALWPSARVVLVVAGSMCVEERAPQSQHRFVAGVGSITIWPVGHHARSLSWAPLAQPFETLSIEVDGPTLARLAPGDAALALGAMTPQLGIKDSALATLVRLMAADVAAECPTGRLYGEALSLALAANVAGRYSTSPAKAPPKGGLSRRELGRVLEYVRAHLGGDLSLPELSRVVGLSPYHFCLAFRTSMSVSPHQYVIGQRIGEARRLLAARRLSVAEVALAVGFANQSHFAEAFRKATGTTPGRYPRES